MSKTVVIPAPRFIQEIALEHKLLLDSVISTEYKFLRETVRFVYISSDHQFEFSFEFQVSYYDDGDDQVFKIADIEGLKSVRMDTLSNEKELMFGGEQLKNTTKQKLTRLVEEFVGSKAR